MTDENAKGFEGWAVCELFGHKRMAGYIGSQEVGGGTLLRLDVPATDPTERELAAHVASPHYYGEPHPTTAYTKLLGLGAIYGITPCTEEVARRAAREIERSNDPLPVQLPALTAPATVPATAHVGYEIEDDDDDDDLA